MDIVPDPDNWIIILRFLGLIFLMIKILYNNIKYKILGTTPQTSNIIQTFNSIIYQISRIFKQTIPDKFFSSKDELKFELEQRLLLFHEQNPHKKLVIVLDSIDQLNPSNYDLVWIITSLPPNTKFIYSTIPNHCFLLEKFNSLFQNLNLNNTLQITALDKTISIEILRDWLIKEKRALTKKQWSVLDIMFDTAVLFPLYIKLIYDFITKWNSFDNPDEEFQKCLNIDKSIVYLFKLLEKKHGKLLFSRSIIYMTVFKNGISECEIEDILSLDDDVLYDVFEYHAPPVRKLPICLWSRIKNALQGYMVEKEIDETRVIYWYHRRFIEVASSFYISKLNSIERNIIFSNLVDFFNETWKTKPKPFKYNEYVAKKFKLNSEEAQQIRDTSIQPTVFRDTNGVIKYNKRKIGELPNFIQNLTSNMAIPLSCDIMYFNFYFLSGLFYCFEYKEITETVSNISQASSYNLSEEAKNAIKEIKLLQLALLQCSFTLTDYPISSLNQILSRLLSIYGYSKYFTKLVDEYDKYTISLNSLVIPYQYLQFPGDDLLFQLERHYYPITCTAIGGDNDSFVFTVSNKLNVLNLQDISDVCNIQIKNGFIKIDFMIVYFQTKFETNDNFKNIPGGVVLATENELMSYSFDFMHSSIIYSNEKINNVFITSDTNIIVSFENKTFIEFRDVIKLELKSRHEFGKNIKSILCNTYHERINQTPLFETSKIFLAVLFQSNEMSLYRIDDINFIKIFSVSPPGYEIFDFKFNSSVNYYSFDVQFLMISFSDGSLMKLPIKQTSNEHDLNLEFNYFLIKFEKENNVSLKIIELNNEMSLFLGSNKHVYVIIDYESLNMMEIEGNFDNAIYITKQRVGCMSNGHFNLYALVYNQKDSNTFYFVSLFSIEAHYEKITFSFIKDSEMMLTTSLDSTLRIFLISKLNENEKFRIKFDKNENYLSDLIPFDSNFAICRLKDSK